MRDAGFPAVFDFSTVDSDYISNLMRLMRLPFYLRSDASTLGTSSYMSLTCSTASMGAKNKHLWPGDDPQVWAYGECRSTFKNKKRGNTKRLSKHRIHRWTAEEVREVLATTPLPLAAGSADAISEHALLLLPQLRLAAIRTSSRLPQSARRTSLEWSSSGTSL